jgi:hypothetical protein
MLLLTVDGFWAKLKRGILATHDVGVVGLHPNGRTGAERAVASSSPVSVGPPGE